MSGNEEVRQQLMVLRRRKRPWSPALEQQFLSKLAETASVKQAALDIGVHVTLPYYRRQRDASFRSKWEEAFAIGYERLEGALLASALAVTEGREQEKAIPPMTRRDAFALLARHRERVATGVAPRSWRKRTPDPAKARIELLKRVAALRRAKLRRELISGRCAGCGKLLSGKARASRNAALST